MSGPNRIDVAGLLCSCIGHAVLLGGFLLSHPNSPPRATESEEAPALMVELIPLERLPGAAEAAEAPEPEIVEPVASQAAVSNVDRRSPLASAPTPPQQPASPALASAGSAPPMADAAPAMSSTTQRDLSDYQQQLYQIIARNSQYPEEAKRRRLSGVTSLAFRLDRMGHVIESWVQASSGWELLDDAALAALDRAQPLPPIPPTLPAPMEFVVEIDSSIMQQIASRMSG